MDKPYSIFGVNEGVVDGNNIDIIVLDTISLITNIRLVAPPIDKDKDN
jgi:hypothetical protein